MWSLGGDLLSLPPDEDDPITLRWTFFLEKKRAHADFSEVVFDGAWKMFVKRGVPEAAARNLDILFVNAWKPYGQTVRGHDSQSIT